MKLEDYVSVRVGLNTSREKENHDLVAYDYEDLTNDLDGLFLDSKLDIINEKPSDDNNIHLSRAGEVVFSFISSKAGIVSDLNEGKIINQNFAKLIIVNEQLDRSYLCYLLNESASMKKKMAISMQGSTVRKLTPSILKELDIDLPGIEKQRIIGKAYLYLKKRQALAKKQAELEEKLLLEILQKLDEK
ncbi:MAG: restriction endonuclease subunit S [Lactobacillus sp.]|nr:restriction endonuclease subunit S [Lactobacillus sp.]